MGTAAKRGKGAAKQLGGKAERTLGRAVGNERMEARGRARELEGKVEKERAKTRARVAGKIEEALGSAERKVAPAAEAAVKAHGSLKRAKGRLRQKLNQSSQDEDA
jgi:uncharacterized protein YjbJ (UPF0337 family)